MEQKGVSLNDLANAISKWRDTQGFVTEWFNTPTKLMLCVTELSEAMEAYRDNNRTNFDEEIADVFIRLLDICGALYIDIEKEIEKKMMANVNRPKLHGRKFDDFLHVNGDDYTMEDCLALRKHLDTKLLQVMVKQYAKH